MKKVREISLFAILPVVLFYLMECYEHNPFQEVRGQAQLFNMALFELVAWILFFLIGSGRAAIWVEEVLAVAFGLTNHYVMLFRSTPFVPWDFFSIKTAQSVAGNYDFTPSVQVILVSLVYVGIGIGVGFLKVERRDFLGLFRMKKHVVKKSLISAMGLVLLLMAFVGRLQDEDFQLSHNLYPFLFTPGYMTQVNGMAVTFAMNLAYIQIEKPKGYSREECREILASYGQNFSEEEGNQPEIGTTSEGENQPGASSSSEEENQPGAGASSEAEKYPNIIVIMDEAFSDLSVLGEVNATEDYMPFMHKLFTEGAPEIVTGYMDMSVCGGNTANSEFEFLTGNTMAFLPDGSIPYQQYIKGETPSMASYLKGLGYSTYAMHPYHASGWSRDQVYPNLGFEESFFLEDYERKYYIRNYVSDSSDFGEIIRKYENKEEGKPLFLFNVTMQNHGGYLDDYEDFKNSIQVVGANNQALDRYLSLIRETDKALEGLIRYFEGEEEDTMIVFFGDHQPNNTVAKSIMTADTPEYLRYEVPYLVWANFELDKRPFQQTYDEASDKAQGENNASVQDETNGKSQNEAGAAAQDETNGKSQNETSAKIQGETSANYLGAMVLEAAGIPLDAYGRFRMELRETYPVLSGVRQVQMKEDSEDLLGVYQKLQYYYLFEKEK